MKRTLGGAIGYSSGKNSSRWNFPKKILGTQSSNFELFTIFIGRVNGAKNFNVKITRILLVWNGFNPWYWVLYQF